MTFIGGYMAINHCMHDFLDSGGTAKQFYEQYKTATPEVGKKYIYAKGNWDYGVVQVLYIHNNVALCVMVEGVGKGNYYLYNSSGLAVGWRYNDSRAYYRLQEEVI